MRLSLAGLVLLGASNALQTAVAEGDTRTISFRHLHTGEDISITYKRNGRYDAGALKKLDWFMRDWRKNQSTQMDPRLFDLLWEVNREVGGARPIEVICGYRASGTNAMLRARSTGVAENSQHVQGNAMDFEIPGVPLEKIREVGLRLQRGGVGFYPTSGSPFVHMDTGSIRHWPRMTHDQLVKVFPDGRTVHVPSDGKPLPGYALALADVEARGKMPNAVSLAAARNAGIETANAEASADEAAAPKRNFLASLFGLDNRNNSGSADASGTQVAQRTAPKRNGAPVVLASALPAAAPKPVAITRIDAPLPKPRPVAQPTVVAAAAVPMFGDRGLWVNAVESGTLAPVAGAQTFAATTPLAGTAADPVTTGVLGRTVPPDVLAYAPATPLPRPAQARPMGSRLASAPPSRAAAPREAEFTVPFAPQLSGGVQRADSPWLRAAMLTPSVSTFMTATPLTMPAMRPLVDLIHKPAQSLVMTFSTNPHLDLVAERFSGSAVVFLATATFATQMTASLR